MPNVLKRLPAQTLVATVPPLASIFGSGFLIIVPILERTLGALAILGVLGVCVFAWLIGTAIRHNINAVEPKREQGQLDDGTRWLEWASDLAIALAYIISVALYLRIMSQYVIEFAGSDSAAAQRGLASTGLAVIVGVGLVRGFGGLDLMERVALIAVLVLTTVLGGTLFFSDAGHLLGGGIHLPPVPDKGIRDVLLVLGGIVITVQGFETVRYLGDEYDRPTRIWACRISQLVSSSIYIGFVAVATPEMGIGSGGGVDSTLLDITDRVVPVLSIAVVVTAVLSQFSAATADTIAAHGNLQGLFPRRMRGVRPYLLSGIVGIILVWAIPTLTLIVIASRAFAAYYALQSLAAMRTSEKLPAKFGFAALALALGAVTFLAQPAG